MRDFFLSLKIDEKLTLWQEFALTGLIVGCAVLLRFAIAPVESGIPYITFFPAVLVVFYVSRLWLGIASAILSAALALYFFSHPYFSFSTDTFALL